MPMTAANDKTSLLKKSSFHVLYLIDELRVRGGTEKHLLEMAIGMAGKGHTVSVFSLGEGDYGREFRENKKFYYNCLHVKRIYDLNGVKAINKIIKYIRRTNVDIVQTFHAGSDIMGPIIKCFSKEMFKTFSSRRDLGFTKSTQHVFVQKILNRYVDGIVANSEAVKDAVISKERYPEGGIRVIYNGIDTGAFCYDPTQRNKQRALYGADENTIVVGSAGNVRSIKGYDILVEAANIVCQNNNNVLFLHVGDGGELMDLLRNCCKELGIEHAFRFLGKTNDVAAFLSALDIYVQPSFSEGFSNAVLEAMATGLAIVATRVGGNKELIDDGRNGILVEAGDPAVLGNKIELLINRDDIRIRLAKEGERMVNDKYTIDTMMNSYEDYYYHFLNDAKSWNSFRKTIYEKILQWIKHHFMV